MLRFLKRSAAFNVDIEVANALSAFLNFASAFCALKDPAKHTNAIVIIGSSSVLFPAAEHDAREFNLDWLLIHPLAIPLLEY